MVFGFCEGTSLISQRKFILYLPGRFPDNGWVQWECFVCLVIFPKIRKVGTIAYCAVGIAKWDI